MKRLHQNKIDDAKYYEKIWGEKYNQRPYHDAVRMRALARDVKDGMKVLDVGAGVFGTCQYIAEETKLDCDLHCIDQSWTAKDIVKARCPQISFAIGDVTELPFVDKEFDVVIAGEIIEHMENPEEFAKELCRVGKVVALSTVNTKSENAIKHGDYPEHIWEFEPEDLVEFFKPYGETEYTTVGDYHFIYCRCR